MLASKAKTNRIVRYRVTLDSERMRVDRFTYHIVVFNSFVALALKFVLLLSIAIFIV